MGFGDYVSKLFKGQRVVYNNEPGFLIPDDIHALSAYNRIAIATRGVNLMADYAAPIELNVYKKVAQNYVKEKADKLEYYLDFPNPYQSKTDFWTQHYIYLLLYGTSYIVLENDGLYILYPPQVEIEPDPKKFIKFVHFGTGANRVSYKPEEVAIVRLPSATSYYLGDGVFNKMSKEINLINRMLTYHDNVMKTGGIHKFVFRTENILGQKIKDRIREEWSKYHAISSQTAGQPPILEGGLSLDKVNVTMEDLDFNKSVGRLEASIARDLGIPLSLLTGEASADVNKIMKLFYLSTILPLVERTCSAMTKLALQQSAWFRLGKKTIYVRPVMGSILGLREDVAQVAKAAQSLYVSGIITKNEARMVNNFPEDTTDATADDYMVPQNIAGSNVNPSQGGRPPKNDEEE